MNFKNQSRKKGNKRNNTKKGIVITLEGGGKMELKLAEEEGSLGPKILAV